MYVYVYLKYNNPGNVVINMIILMKNQYYLINKMCNSEFFIELCRHINVICVTEKLH